MKIIKQLYGLMSKKEMEETTRILSLEINAYLHKIYRTMKRKVPLKPADLPNKKIILKQASLGATKMWEFRLNKRDEVAGGNVGKITVVTRGLEDNTIRKQRALFIAAEFYTYHAFANHPDYRVFNSIRCQNQYWDMIKKSLGLKNAHDTRDQAIRYMIEEIKEHKLAHTRAKGWFISVSKLKKHDPDMAQALGSSEEIFNEIFKKQHQRFTVSMLKQEEDLVRKEIEDIDHIIRMIRVRERKKLPNHLKSIFELHVKNLELFRSVLVDILQRFDRWVIIDKKEHDALKKQHLPMNELHKMLQTEAKEERVDINKIHFIFEHFKKEKINILRDVELL